jgi:drug/metabolite transporter (DMT)-like permease
MNTAKASVAFALLCVTLPVIWLFTGAFTAPSTTSALVLLLSGAVGLGVGDLFLLEAFVRIGVSRTLMLYGFQPLILGLGASLFFNQSFDTHRLIAIAFLIACLMIFSLERYRETRSWEIRGLLMAVVGVSMDSGGVLLTRFAFEQSPQTRPLEGHLVRCAGALISYAVIAGLLQARRKLKNSSDTTPVIGLISNFKRFDLKSRSLMLLGCFGGTYLSLCLYLTAIQIGHLASISAIAITGPMFAALLESIIAKKRPSPYLLAAFVFFLGGFSILLS